MVHLCIRYLTKVCVLSATDHLTVDTGADGVRVGCDFMVLIFIYDEFTDKVDDDGARVYADMVMDAIRNPHAERPQDEPKLGEIARQYVHSF